MSRRDHQCALGRVADRMEVAAFDVELERRVVAQGARDQGQANRRRDLAKRTSPQLARLNCGLALFHNLREVQSLAGHSDYGHRHAILRERPGLVGADDVDRAERLDGGQLADQGVAAEHSLGPDGQGNRNDGGQPFRHHRHGHADRGQEHRADRLASHHAHEQDQRRHDDARNSQGLADPVQLLLQGRGLGGDLLNHPGDLAQLGPHGGLDHHRRAATVGGRRAEIDHVAPVAQGQIALR